MKRNRTVYDTTEIDSERKVDSGWATSYADMVTLLLCFFILFFSIEKASNQNNPDIADDILVSIGKSFRDQEKPNQTQSSSGKTIAGAKNGSQSDVQGFDGGRAAHWMHGISQKFEKMKFIRTKINERQLILQFADIEFFRRGSYMLTPAGSVEVTKVYNVLRDHKNKLLIEIIGHSDSVPVSRRHRSKFDSNIELSTLRALNVFKFLEVRGMSRENMVIAGYSDSLPIEGMNEKIVSPAFQRRVSFKIHQK